MLRLAIESEVPVLTNSVPMDTRTFGVLLLFTVVGNNTKPGRIWRLSKSWNPLPRKVRNESLLSDPLPLYSIPSVSNWRFIPRMLSKGKFSVSWRFHFAIPRSTVLFPPRFAEMGFPPVYKWTYSVPPEEDASASPNQLFKRLLVSPIDKGRPNGAVCRSVTRAIGKLGMVALASNSRPMLRSGSLQPESPILSKTLPNWMVVGPESRA